MCESHITLASIRVIYGAQWVQAEETKHRQLRQEKKMSVVIYSKGSKHDEYRFIVIELSGYLAYVIQVHVFIYGISAQLILFFFFFFYQDSQVRPEMGCYYISSSQVKREAHVSKAVFIKLTQESKSNFANSLHIWEHFPKINRIFHSMIILIRFV